jgi:hypothetical protein
VVQRPTAGRFLRQRPNGRSKPYIGGLMNRKRTTRFGGWVLRESPFDSEVKRPEGGRLPEA